MGRRDDREERDPLEDAGIPDLSEGEDDRFLRTGVPAEMPPPPSDRPVDADATTAEGQRRGRSLDARLAEETRRGEPPAIGEPGQLVDATGDTDVDEDAELVGSDLGGQDEGDPEDRAMHLVDDAPGGVDAPDAYVEPDADERP